MSGRGNFGGRTRDVASYSEEQVESVIRQCGVDVDSQTENDFLCFCPIHGGSRDTPSFSISKTKGSFICFNPSCGEMGTLIELVKKVSDRNEFEARRLILKAASDNEADRLEVFRRKLQPKEDFVGFPQSVLDRMYEDFWKTPHAIEYMTKERGFTEETLRYFKIGYSNKRGIVAVPMHDSKGMPIGVVGRPASTTSKYFRNSDKLPKSKTLWNLHRAKRTGGTVIVVESSFDAMRVHQAGFPNVVATLGGHLSDYHIEQLDRHFTCIIIMTDMDDKHFYDNCAKCRRAGFKVCHGHNPGRDLGRTIVEKMTKKRVLWASYEDKVVYPHKAKDAGNMTDDEIRQCIRNAVSNFVYRQWKLY